MFREIMAIAIPSLMVIQILTIMWVAFKKTKFKRK